MRRLRLHAATQLDPTRDRINRHHFTGARFRPRVVWLIANADLVFLVRIEPVAKDVGTILLPDLPAELDRADRFPILDQLLIGQRALPVALPPLRLAPPPLPVSPPPHKLA